MEAISVFDIFKIGVGPSSSHTLGPWRAAQRFVARLSAADELADVRAVQVDLYGSLAKTGRGHGTDVAVVLGLLGEEPETCDTAALFPALDRVRATGRLALAGGSSVPFHPADDILFHGDVTLQQHPNALRFRAILADCEREALYLSIGGGFVVGEGEAPEAGHDVALPMPIESADDLRLHCERSGLDIPGVVRTNEAAWRPEEETRARLRRIAETMRACVYRGALTEGVLPGGLGVRRRAAAMSRRLLGDTGAEDADCWLAAIRARRWGFEQTVKWVSCFALAVNEENAAFGRVVTAPTNGAAGVIPAVMLYYQCFCGADEYDIERFLLTAGEIGSIFKKGSTISAAQGGCQAEIGVSSAMAAGALCHCLGGSVEQALMAAEIAMEHHLGMTCDPVGGLVQVPCIERNTMGAMKAIAASSLALEGDPAHARVSLDQVIRSMWETAQDMSHKYKETAEGGLALQIAVNVAEC